MMKGTGSPAAVRRESSPFTFSITTTRGFSAAAQFTNSKKSELRGSFGSLAGPATLKPWHGGPPISTSQGRPTCFRIERCSRKSRISPCKTRCPSRLCRTVSAAHASTSSEATGWNPAISKPRPKPPAPENRSTNVGEGPMLGTSRDAFSIPEYVPKYGRRAITDARPAVPSCQPPCQGSQPQARAEMASKKVT